MKILTILLYVLVLGCTSSRLKNTYPQKERDSFETINHTINEILIFTTVKRNGKFFFRLYYSNGKAFAFESDESGDGNIDRLGIFYTNDLEKVQLFHRKGSDLVPLDEVEINNLRKDLEKRNKELGFDAVKTEQFLGIPQD